MPRLMIAPGKVNVVYGRKGRAMLKAPFPWFGGKSRISRQVWKRFGDVPNYVEPFAGSLAVLLARPHEPRVETVNDANCYVANFWRALSREPETVAHHADWPVNEADLHARKRRLHEMAEHVARVKSDPEFYDAKLAGWWVWGVSQSIGDDWPKLGGDFLHQKLPSLSQPGMGVHRSSLPHLGDPGTGVQAYLLELAERLRRVRVCCGDWRRVLTPSVTTKHGPTAVFLDPPYDGYADIYSDEPFDFEAVLEWAIEHGDDPLFRIALCGYDLEAPEGWELMRWRANRGYSNSDNENRKRETVIFSPYCRKFEQRELYVREGAISKPKKAER